MVSARTVGSLSHFTICGESTYGVGASTGFQNGGSLITHNDKTMAEILNDNIEGSRMISSTPVIIGKDYGWSADFRVNLIDVFQQWMKYALGNASTGVQNELPSFSARFNYDASEHQAFYGCKIDTFGIKAEGRGKPLVFSADVVSRYATPISANNVFNNLGTNHTFTPQGWGAEPPLCYTNPLQYVLPDAPSTYIDAKAKSWSLEIKNNLQSEADVVTAGGVDYILNAGIDSVPQDSEITLSFDVLSTSSLWDVMKKANQQIGFKVKIASKWGSYFLNMTGYLTGEMPSRSQGTYDETVNVRVSNCGLTIS